MNVLITGASGMLGRDLSDVFRRNGHDILATDRATLDITDRDAVLDFVEVNKPHVIVNAAAYNFVDKVEEADIFSIAMAVNGEAPGHLAEAAATAGIPFVHVSSDYVFPGEKPEGYVEDDEPRAISKYGETKLAGERAALARGGRAYVVRTSKLFGEPGVSTESKESFVRLMLRLAKEKPQLSIVDEETGSPTYTPDLAVAIYQLVTDTYVPGIYHLVNSGEPVTWYAFAREIFDVADVAIPTQPVTSVEFPKPAQRPKFAPLLNTKFPALRERGEALREFLSKDR